MTTKPEDVKFIVTIGREFGSGGHEIGKRLAKEMGIAFYDTELLELAVAKTGYHEDYIRSNDEKAPDFAAGPLFSGMEYYQPSPYDKIQVEVRKIIEDIAENESAVIVGRAADYILRDKTHVSVFLFAPMEDRIKRKMALLDEKTRSEITDSMMEKTIRQRDKQRRRFYEYYTDMRWGARDTYDLLINTSRAGIEGSVKIIETFIKEGYDENILPD